MSAPAEQRVAWAAQVAGPGALDLGALDDPVAALQDLAQRGRTDGGAHAATWVEGYDADADDALEAAAASGVRLVVAVPPADGPRLAARLGGELVPQWEAVIGEGAPEEALCHLVCANVAPPPTRVASLERAVSALRAANAGLARRTG